MGEISYLITDPKYYSNSLIKFKKTLKKAIKKHPSNMVCLRDKKSKNIKKLAKHFLILARKSKKIAILNSNINLAYFLGYDGVHLPSNMFNKIKLAKRKKLFVIVSCHSLEEIKKVQKLGADMVTFSPIFYSPKKGEPKGVKKLREAVFKSKIPVIALGGIVSNRQIHKVLLKKSAGFASIRYFVG